MENTSDEDQLVTMAFVAVDSNGISVKNNDVSIPFYTKRLYNNYYDYNQ